MALCVVSSAVEVARQESFSRASSAGKVARQDCFASTARQQQHHSAGAFFSFAFKQRARGDALLQRATCTTDQTAMGLCRDETKPHRTTERRVIFSPQWPNLLDSETDMVVIQDCDRAGHHTFMPMAVMLLFGWMVGDDAAAIKQY